MTEQLEDDVQTMLARRAGDVRVSPVAWDEIAARLDEPVRSGRRAAAFAGIAIAAALIAGVIVVAQNDQSTPTVTATTTTVQPTNDRPRHVWEGGAGQDVRAVVSAYLKNRTGTDITANYDFTMPAEVQATFRSRDVETKVFAEKAGNRWLVISAASALVPIQDPSFDGTMSTAVVMPRSDGQLFTAFGTEAWDGPHDVQAGESVPVRRAGDGSIRALLRTSDGTIGLSEVMPTLTPLPAARRFLVEDLGLGDVAIDLDDFRQGDTTSGEIPYSIEGGSGGTILMRQDAGGGWLVAAITSDTLAVHQSGVPDGLDFAVSDLDADTVEVSLTDEGHPVATVSVRPGQSARIPSVPAYDVRAVARKDGRVVAIFVNELNH